jgi:iron complex transport system ATP-binding protein
MQNMNLAAIYCDHLVFMKKGRVAANGAVQDILTAETIRSVFNVESKIQFDAYAGANQIVFKR